MDSVAEAESVLWDAVVIGTGIGGSTVGYELAKAGHRVLFLERGRNTHDGSGDVIAGRHVEDAPEFRRLSNVQKQDWLVRGGRANDELTDDSGPRSSALVPYVGCGSGGSSALFGMVMERFLPVDFTPGDAFPDASGSSLPERWPIAFEDLRPWYVQAERLFRVRGTADPLRPDAAREALLPVPPPSPETAQLLDWLAQRGMHPYRSHKACEWVSGCKMCQGFMCASDCRNGAARICLEPATKQHGARLLTECAAVFLEADRRDVRQVRCAWRGQSFSVRAKLVVLAAGALMSPALLLNSRSEDWPDGLANESGLVGRNLMRHVIDLYVLTRAPRVTDFTQVREIIFNDFYVHGQNKLGSVQAFGVAPPLDYIRNQPGPNLWRLMGPAAPFVWKMNSRSPILASILEDLPYPENRIWPDGPLDTDRRQRLHYRYRLGQSEDDRTRAFRRLLTPLLQPLRPVRVFGTSDRKALGHVCGTCRFGTDPRASVLDPWNRAHGLSNLYVVDASFFPTSAGLNPALTVAANALRVAQHLKTRL
ncbi:MAG: FAD-dependent oxidoreductase [Burkholderiales bacterium]